MFVGAEHSAYDLIFLDDVYVYSAAGASGAERLLKLFSTHFS